LKKKADKLPSIFFTAGKGDFNYFEMQKAGAMLDKLGVANRVRRFDGVHQWAPADVQKEAVEWLVVLEMKTGRRTKDEAFLAEQFRETRERAEAQLATRSDRLYAIGSYNLRKTAELFDGLADPAQIATVRERAASVEADKRTRNGLKLEQEDYEILSKTAGTIEGMLGQLAQNAPERGTLMMEVRSQIDDARRHYDALQKKDPEAALPYKIAMASVYATMVESGERALRANQGANGLTYFSTAAAIWPDNWYVHLGMARSYMRLKNRKSAFASLSKAVASGMNDASELNSADEFTALHDDAEYKSILEKIAAAKNAPAKPSSK